MRSSTFNGIVETIDTALPFDPKWGNGTGYFDDACHMVKLAAGARAKSEDTHGRKIVMVGTRFGTVVFFERFKSEVAGRDVVITCNLPHRLRHMLPSGAVDENMFFIFTGSAINIGTTIENMFTLTKRDMMKDALMLTEPGSVIIVGGQPREITAPTMKAAKFEDDDTANCLIGCL